MTAVEHRFQISPAVIAVAAALSLLLVAATYYLGTRLLSRYGPKR